MARRLRFYEDDELAIMISRAGFEHAQIRRDPRTFAQQAAATWASPDNDH